LHCHRYGKAAGDVTADAMTAAQSVLAVKGAASGMKVKSVAKKVGGGARRLYRACRWWCVFLPAI
jgi:hypothetical protein